MHRTNGLDICNQQVKSYLNDELFFLEFEFFFKSGQCNAYRGNLGCKGETELKTELV